MLFNRAALRPGQTILVYGASGAVGTNAVQLARNLFGAEVTGVCSTANLGLVKSLGASQMIDYTRQDFTQTGVCFDVVFDAVARMPPARAKKALKKAGVNLNVHRDARARTGGTARQELLTLKELLEAGQFKPVIDRVYPLEQVAAAHHYVEQGHKRGNVVVNVNPD